MTVKYTCIQNVLKFTSARSRCIDSILTVNIAEKNSFMEGPINGGNGDTPLCSDCSRVHWRPVHLEGMGLISTRSSLSPKYGGPPNLEEPADATVLEPMFLK